VYFAVTIAVARARTVLDTKKLVQYSPSIRSINSGRTSLLSRVRPVSSGLSPVLLAAQFACRSKEALLCILRASQWRRRCSLRHSAAHCPVLPAENDRPATHSSCQALPDCPRALLALIQPRHRPSTDARWRGPDQPVDGMGWASTATRCGEITAHRLPPLAVACTRRYAGVVVDILSFFPPAQGGAKYYVSPRNYSV
jgi:hypothetical protein